MDKLCASENFSEFQADSAAFRLTAFRQTNTNSAFPPPSIQRSADAHNLPSDRHKLSHSSHPAQR